MQATPLSTYPVTVGQRQIYVFNGTGPKSYSQTTGDVISFPPGFYADMVNGAVAVSKNYVARAIPSAIGFRPTWQFKWYSSAGTEVSNATDLSAESVQFEAIGGNF